MNAKELKIVIKEAKIKERNEKAQIEQDISSDIMEAIAEYKKQKLAEDPNYVFYQLNQQHILSALDLVLGQGKQPYAAMVEVCESITAAAQQDEPNWKPEKWLGKVQHKHPLYGNMGVKAYQNITVLGSDAAKEKVMNMKETGTYSVAELGTVTTFNAVLNEAQRQAKLDSTLRSLVQNDRDKEKRIMELEAKLAKLEGKVDNQEERISTLESGSVLSWKEQAIAKYKGGMKVAQIAREVGKGRQTVSTYINSAEAKALLN